MENMSVIAEDIQIHWRIVQPLFSIRDEKEYDKAIATLDALIDEVGTDEQHPLYELLDTLGTIVDAYEEKHHPIPECSGVEVLKFLMEEHQLEPSDLPALGSPDAVKEILKGERDLTVMHIHALAETFKVSPAVFL
ncbi:transcriptional regulator [Candidatus Poribacteria bacterium]|nr:transcriptional regulator [Candidatus Poribacteria bacterium]MYK20279.1 transcriptional regulator [Candidatus Poribacteria bacterium]